MTTESAVHHRLSARRTLALVIGLIPVAVLAIAAILLAPLLGSTIASHWSALDRPDGFSSTWGSFAGTAAIVVALTVATVVLLVRARSRSVARLWVGMSVLVATAMAVAWVVSAVATASASRPQDAVLGWGLAVVLASIPLGALAFVTVDGDDLGRASGRSVAPATLAPGERVAWVGRAGSRLFLWLGIAVGVGGLVLIGLLARVADSQPTWIAGLVTAIAGASTLALADVTLSIDERGLRLVSSIFRIPLFRIPLADVSGVVVETIEPMQWGGWGLRISGSGRAYVTGRAEGLVVARNNGAPTAITIAHASDAASVLEALARR